MRRVLMRASGATRRVRISVRRVLVRHVAVRSLCVGPGAPILVRGVGMHSVAVCGAITMCNV